jgi:hypothetical protein
MGSLDKIEVKIDAFRRRYYLSLLIRGLLLTLTISTLYFLLVTLLEYTFWLSSVFRFSILLVFFLLVGYCVFRFLSEPLKYWIASKGINNEQSARIIGGLLPQINDRLLNLIQLAGLTKYSSLAYASVTQKAAALESTSFEQVISGRENYKYIQLILVPILFVALLLIFNKSVLTQSTHRIVHFNQTFTPQAPFQYIIENPDLVAFRNEDFTVTLTLAGSAVPDRVHILSGTQRLKMEPVSVGQFVYTFQKIQEPRKIQFEAASFRSEEFEILVANRPELTQLKAELEFPNYLQRKNEVIANAGALEVPEGTLISWKAQTAFANLAYMRFKDEEPLPLQGIDNQLFIIKKRLFGPTQYELTLQNEKSTNKERISYPIEVIKDQFPQIVVNTFSDSVFYKQVVLGGAVTDDYGLSELRLHYQIKDTKQHEMQSGNFAIPILRNQAQQSFFYNWRLDSIGLRPGDQLEYFLQVWDNDGVNGRKATRSASYNLFVPDKDQLANDISRSQSKTEQALQESAQKAEGLRKQMEDSYQKLKGKQSLDWLEKKRLEEILEQRKNLDQLIKELSEANKSLEKKKDAFTEQDERIRQKAEQIQKLMDELLDEETRKLIEELQKLLRENADPAELQKLMDKLNRNSKNLENELERTLELFKQLQLEYKMDQVAKDLQQDIKAQQQLLEKTEELDKAQNDKRDKGKDEQVGRSQELAKEQELLNQDFKKTAEKLDEVNQLAEELRSNDEFPGPEDASQVDKLQKESQENLQENSPSKSKQQQRNAIQKMQEMKQQLENMQESMMMEMDMRNIESLRQIIHGLIKLSFDQEGLIKQFGELQANDPRFNSLAQQQLKLKDNVKVLEDSLLALAKRDEMMGSFITREINELNDHLTKAIEANRERRRQPALSEMQFSMTSLNNLALMLDSHFDMLMQMMANAKPSMKSKQKGKEPNLSQLQQQLNNRIEQLKNSGKEGRQFSEELAEMAAEQERIRRALQQMQEKMKQDGAQLPGNEISDKMEQTEIDLVNKRLTDQLIQRQKEILTRLLETEKSMREQDLDEERKGETAKDYQNEMPKAIEEYLKLKEKEVELLKSMPPRLYPFYKKEVGEYFKRLREN